MKPYTHADWLRGQIKHHREQARRLRLAKRVTKGPMERFRLNCAIAERMELVRECKAGVIAERKKGL